MPERREPAKRLELEPPEIRQSQLLEYQKHWYHHCLSFCRGKSVLDVGAGTGYGIRILRPFTSSIEGIDLIASGPDVREQSIDTISDRSWNIVLAVDVIEHVQDDTGFLNHLLRVAREGVFFSTPNYAYTQCKNEYHVREYSPQELKELIANTGKRYSAWTSDSHLRITTLYNLGEGKHNYGILLRVQS
jgi:2-polyprenyl-3-methyl-5-hydroxy-6-metoxy-1,4-benzoquinol methylase